jgi:dipeptidyl aminopeptidase/acylaminoacyl peptidase
VVKPPAKALWAALAWLMAWPAAAGPSQRALVETIDISSLAISPDGRWVAFREDQASIERNRRTLSWWVAPVDGAGEPQRISDGGDAIFADYGVLKSEPPRWSADGRAIYFRMLLAGQIQIWRADLAGQAARMVTQDEADVAAFGLTAEGRRLVYVAGASREAIRQAEAREYEQGVRIDASVDPSQSLFAAMEVNGRLASQRLVGSWFDHAPLLADQPAHHLALELPGGRARSAMPEEIEAAGLAPVAKARLLATPDLTAASLDKRGMAMVVGEGAARLLKVERPDGRTIPCARSICRDRIVGLAWRGTRDELILTTQDLDRRQALAIWRIGDRVVRPIHHGDGMLNGGDALGSTCAASDAVAICVDAAAATPPRLVRIDLETGAAAILAEPNLVLARQPAIVEALAWHDANGRRFTGQLVRPTRAPPAAPWPLFVTYYLCDGFLRGGEGDEWPLAAFADAGIAALCVNKITSPPTAFDPVADYKVGQAGLESVIDLLVGQRVVDPRKIGMGGLSFGSEATTWMAMHSDRLAAASIASTQVEPTYYWANAVAGRDVPKILRQAWGLGPPGETPELWQALSPALNVDRIRAPMLIQIPEQEYRMIPEFIARLSRSTTPSEIYAFPNEPHVLVQPRHRAAAYARNLDWFRFWLQDYVDPDPLKAEQYRRWILMKSGRPAPR